MSLSGKVFAVANTGACTDDSGNLYVSAPFGSTFHCQRCKSHRVSSIAGEARISSYYICLSDSVRDRPMPQLKLSEFCIYTIVHRDKLAKAASGNRSTTFPETKAWTTGYRLWRKAQAEDRDMPVVFADANRQFGGNWQRDLKNWPPARPTTNRWTSADSVATRQSDARRDFRDGVEAKVRERELVLTRRSIGHPDVPSEPGQAAPLEVVSDPPFEFGNTPAPSRQH